MKEEKEETKITGKQLKLVILIVLDGMLVLLLVWSMTPAKIYEVSEIYDELQTLARAQLTPEALRRRENS